MKNSQRYRLNRLADSLVTPERFSVFSPGWLEYDGPVIFDEMNAPSPDVLALLSMPKLTVDEANAEVQGMIAQKIRDEGPQCPFGNPDCHLPDAPIGLGLHKPCMKLSFHLDRLERLVDTLAGR